MYKGINGKSTVLFWGGTFKLLRSPGIDSKESILRAYVASEPKFLNF
jgi:hypothetical protein